MLSAGAVSPHEELPALQSAGGSLDKTLSFGIQSGFPFPVVGGDIEEDVHGIGNTGGVAVVDIIPDGDRALGQLAFISKAECFLRRGKHPGAGGFVYGNVGPPIDGGFFP